MAKLFANSGHRDQTPHSAASDMGLYCFQITLLKVSRLKWVNVIKMFVTSRALAPVEYECKVSIYETKNYL